jgi:hypothetical protein
MIICHILTNYSFKTVRILPEIVGCGVAKSVIVVVAAAAGAAALVPRLSDIWSAK